MRSRLVVFAVVWGLALTVVSSAWALAPSPPKFVALSNSMITNRDGPAVATTNGKVLVAGGAENVGYGSGAANKVVELFDPAGGGGVFAEAGAQANLTTSRYFDSAAPLPAGKVLITGGFTEGGVTLSSAAIYDPATGQTTNLPVEAQTPGPETQMHTPREAAFAAPLADGRVLVGGGRSSAALRSAEIFDPATDDFTTIESMESTREGAAAAPLPNGDVLVAGGVNNLGAVLASVEIYDPTTGQFAEPPESMGTPRTGAIASQLPDGMVLIAGGISSGTTVLRSAEIFNPATREFTPLPETGTSQLTIARANAAATLLPDGRALILGGTHDTTDALKTAEVFESAPEAQASDVNFGNHVLSVGTSQTVTVTNLGDQALEVEGFVLGGPNPGDFSVGASTCAAPVALHGTCTFTVNFDPSALGERVATIRLSDNEPVPLTLIVKGTGLQPPAAIDTTPKPVGSTPPTPPAPTFDVLDCRPIKGAGHKGQVKQSRCTVSTAPGVIQFTSSSIRATLRLRGAVVATGRAASKSGRRLELTPSKQLVAGKYRLMLSFLSKRHHRQKIASTITIK
jgi:hypothetical protein